jgi:aldose 1-epimerase
VLPSGEQYSVAGFGYTAAVTEVGATLRHLDHHGRHLVRGFRAKQMMPVHSGAVLAPWPNRVAGGRYTFAGREQQLPLSEPTRGNAIHGLVAWEPWYPVSVHDDTVTLGCKLFPRTGYPHLLELEMTYSATDAGLLCSLLGRNAGDEPAPYGASAHPYLVAGPGHADDWTLEVPATNYLQVTPDRLLPTGLAPVEGTELDFRVARKVGGVALDHAYTDLVRADGGLTGVRVLAADGHGVAVSWDESCPWVQVHTADRPEVELNRTALAVEPMTCPPDAFNSGTDLVVLEPGGEHRARWSITAV